MLIERLVLHEYDDDRTTIKFSDILQNQEIPDNVFKNIPGKGEEK